MDGNAVKLRPDTQDAQSFEEATVYRYHVPPVALAPKTVLDLGANIGLTAASYQSMWPEAKIVAVEMDAGNVEMFKQNAPGIRVIHAAVSTRDGVGAYDSSAGTNAYALSDTGDTSVRRVTIPMLCEAEFGGPVDFCKMDIEGEEWKMLGDVASWFWWVRKLLVELHDGPSRERAMNVLEWVGYSTLPHETHPRAIFAWR